MAQEPEKHQTDLDTQSTVVRYKLLWTGQERREEFRKNDGKARVENWVKQNKMV